MARRPRAYSDPAEPQYVSQLVDLPRAMMTRDVIMYGYKTSETHSARIFQDALAKLLPKLMTQ
jgi:hypothetical protein